MIPQKLVQAAAERIAVFLRVHADEGWSADQEPVQAIAHAVLAAAFAALPECEELPGARTHEGRMIYAALARDYGEGT